MGRIDDLSDEVRGSIVVWLPLVDGLPEIDNLCKWQGESMLKLIM